MMLPTMISPNTETAPSCCALKDIEDLLLYSSSSFPAEEATAKSLWHEHGRGKFMKFWLGYFSVSTDSRAFGQMATLYHVICIWVVIWSCQTVRSPSYIMLISVIESSIGVLLPECSILEAETTFCNDLSGLVSDSYASMPDSMAAFQPVSAEAIDGKKLLDVFSWGSPYHAKGKQESVS